MAKNLGIKINVDFPSVAELQKQLESKLGNNGLKVKVKFDASESIGKLKNQLTSAFDKKFKIKVDISDKQIIRDLAKVEKRFQDSQARMSGSLGKNAIKGLQASDGSINGLTKSSRILNKTVFETSKGVGKIQMGVNTATSMLNKLKQVQGSMNEKLPEGVYRASDAMNKAFKQQIANNKEMGIGVYRASDVMRNMALEQQKVNENIKSGTEQYKRMAKASTDLTNSEKRSMVSASNKVDRLKEIASIMKEINSLEMKKIGSDDKTQQVIDKRINSLKSLQKTLQDNFMKKTGVNSEDSALIKETKALGQYKLELKEIAAEKARQKALTAKDDNAIRELMALENKRFALRKRAETAGSAESSELNKQAAALDKQISKLKQVNRFENASAESLKKLNAMYAENSRLQARSKAKLVDKESAENLKSLKADLKQIYALKDRINNINIQKKHGVASSGADIELKGLKDQLKLVRQVHEAKLKTARQDGKLTSGDSAKLNNLRKEMAERQKLATITHTTNAKKAAYSRNEASQIAESKNALREYAAQLKKISGLYDKLSSAGRFEAQGIEDVIRAEERRYSIMKKQASLRNKMTPEHAKELSRMEQSEAVNRENNRRIQRGAQLDKDLSQYSLQDMFNPRRIYGDARQAFSEILESVGRVDAAIVDIAKVADEPSSKIKEFTDNVYSYASKFGVSADGYAEAVGKWITTGKSLSESVELANASVMGSFVGNISEDEMVKYMAVPLNAFKKEALEATDIINAMNEVSNNNAIEMNDLGAAYERSAATAAQAGTSFAQLTGMITGAQEATRAGGEKIGTALKAMDVNLGKIGSKLTKGDQAKYDFFKNIGVDILDSNNQLRSTYDILTDLSKVWDNLSAIDQSTAGSYIAGKNHSAVFSGLLANWETVKKAAKEAQGQVDLVDKESGSAFKEFESQQNSVQFALAGLKNAWDELLYTISGGKDGVSAVLNTMTKGLQKVTELAKVPELRKLGGGLLKATAIMTATSAATKFFTVISAGTRTALRGFGRMGGSLIRLSGLFAKTGRAAKTAKLDGVATSASGIAKTGGVIAKMGRSIGGLIPVIGGVISILSILDAMGLPVWEKIGEGISKVTQRTHKAKKATDDYVKASQKAIKEDADNFVLNGTSEKIKDTIEGYNTLIAKKKEAIQKQRENGQKPAELELSKDEFLQVKKGIERAADDLGVEINVDVNDMGEIDKLITRLDNLKAAKDRVEGKKALKSLGKDTATDSFDKIRKGIEKDRESEIGKLERKNKRLEKVAKNSPLKAFREQAEKEIDQYNAKLKELRTIDPSEFKKAIEQRTKELESFQDKAASIRREMKNGNLRPSYDNASKKEQERVVAIMASEIPILSRKAKLIQDTNRDIEKGNKLSLESMRVLQKADPETFFGKGTNTSNWDEDTKGKALSILKKQSEEANAKLQETRNILEDLKNTTNKDINIDKIMDSAAKGGKAFVDEMLRLGDVGANILGVSGTFMASTEDWQGALARIQSQLDSMPDEKKIKFGLVRDDGVLDFEVADMILSLPDEVKTKWGLVRDDGSLDIDGVTTILDQLNDKKINPEFKFDFDGDKIITAKELVDGLAEKDGKEILMALGITPRGLDEAETKIKGLEDKKNINTEVNVKANTDEAEGKIKGLTTNKFGFMEQIPIDANTDAAKGKIDSLTSNIGGEAKKVPVDADTASAEGKIKGFFSSIIDGLKPVKVHAETAPAEKQIAQLSNGNKKAEVTVTANTSQASSSIGEVKSRADAINALQTILNIRGNNTDAMTKADSVVTKGNYIGGMRPVLTVTANTSAATSALAELRSLASTPITAHLNIIKTTTERVKKVNESVAIDTSKYGLTSTNLGKSLSVSVGGLNKLNTVGISKSTKSGGSSKSKESKVDEDVWRYWAKELFKGLPLERTMNNLNNSIKKAGDNQERLISLYKEQNALLTRQEAYNKEMRSAKQAELNSVMAKLRADGFRTKGNQITNFERAKAFSGDKASEVNENLRKYKELYRSIDDLTGKINSISVEKFENNEKIKKAAIEREMKALESLLKRTEAAMKAITNRTDIQERKNSYVSDSDYELKMVISEEGANLAAKSVEDLIEQFNILSKTRIEHAENAEQVKSKMEDFRNEILKNADAILQYNKAMDDLRIERITSDFDKFNDVIKRNIGYLEKNINHLKDGLAEGTDFRSLTSAHMSPYSITRKSSMEIEVERRLRLEDDLNKALDAFAKKNVDRAKNVSNAILEIEQSKYNALLKMQKEYTNGYVSTYKVTNPQIAIGRVAVGKDDKEHIDWINKMGAANTEYVQEYKRQSEIYQRIMRSNASAREKEVAKNNFIISQLRAQERMYRSIVKFSEETAGKILKELENPRLTTDQRNKLQDEFNKLKEESISAQTAISDTIKKRYEFAFELIDEANKRLKDQTEKFERILAIANAASLKPEQTSSLIKTVFAAKARELANAREELDKLIKQQNALTHGSLEWNLLAERIEKVTDNVHELTIKLLEANKSILENQVKIIEDKVQKGLLGGKTLEQYQDFRDRWLKGVARELELEKLRIRAVDLENDMINRKLEALERQERLSKRDTEYLDKQMKVMELQQKLSNLDKERNVQTIARRDDGTWGWEYVKDMSEYDKTKDELLDARRELEDYKDSQRESYVSDLSKLIQKAKDSKYDNVEDLQKEIHDLREAYGTILDDIPDLNFGNIDEFIEAYGSYLRNNKYIVSEIAGVGSKEQFASQIELLGSTIENSFKNATNEIIKVVTAELRNVLRLSDIAKKEQSSSKSVVIQSQELSFPNVTDADGLEEVFLTLPETVSQKINSKW